MSSYLHQNKFPDSFLYYVFIEKKDLCDYDYICIMSSGLMFDEIIMNITRKNNTCNISIFIMWKIYTLDIMVGSKEYFVYRGWVICGGNKLRLHFISPFLSMFLNLTILSHVNSKWKGTKQGGCGWVFIKVRKITVSPRGFMNTNILFQWLDHFNSVVTSSSNRHFMLIFDGCVSHKMIMIIITNWLQVN